MLRAVPPMFGSQFPGVVVMFAAILVLFFLPWLDRSPVKSVRYKGPIFKARSPSSRSPSWCWPTSGSSPRPRPPP
jgi:hypothetical protein